MNSWGILAFNTSEQQGAWSSLGPLIYCKLFIRKAITSLCFARHLTHLSLSLSERCRSERSLSERELLWRFSLDQVLFVRDIHRVNCKIPILFFPSQRSMALISDKGWVYNLQSGCWDTVQKIPQLRSGNLEPKGVWIWWRMFTIKLSSLYIWPDCVQV